MSSVEAGRRGGGVEGRRGGGAEKPWRVAIAHAEPGPAALLFHKLAGAGSAALPLTRQVEAAN